MLLLYRLPLSSRRQIRLFHRGILPALRNFVRVLCYKRSDKNERGVSTTTASVIYQFIVNINISVPSIVTMPENIWVNPCKRPVETISMSVTTVFIMSPCAVESIYESGTFVSFQRPRFSFLNGFNESLFELYVIIHWKSAETTMHIARTAPTLKSLAKSTSPLAVMQSTPLPMRMGTISDSAMPTNAEKSPRRDWI